MVRKILKRIKRGFEELVNKIFGKKGGKFLSLTQEQIEDNWKFTKKYFGSKNTASASQVDSNSNVSEKSVAVMNSEMFKKYFVQMNRHAMKEKLAEMGRQDLVEQYEKDIKGHNIYVHDETGNLLPYCCSISLYPFILNGTKHLDGKSESPKHLSSFCSTFPNFIYQIASNFSGAVATVEFLMMFDYFARKDYGDDYTNTHKEDIAQHLQSVVYSLNQPAVARGCQSVFWNISIFDEFYFKGMFDEMVFPDGSTPKYESLAKLQDYFMEWFRKERLKKPLTFPVVTASLLETENKKPKDVKFFDMITTQMGKGHSFFIYNSENADSLSSCCFDGGQLAEIFNDGKSVKLSFKEMYDRFKGSVLEIPYKGSLSKGKVVRLPKRKMYEVVTEHLDRMVVTDNHIFPTLDGDKEVRFLSTEDTLLRDAKNCIKGEGIKSVKEIKEYTKEFVYCFEMQNQNEPYFTLPNGVITHNCRLKNEIQENEFSYTLGAGGVMTGSCNVITLNMNRIEQTGEKLEDILQRVYQYQIAQRAIYQDVIDRHGLPAFEGGFISLDKLYSTIGINGLLEASEFLGEPIESYASRILGFIKQSNKDIRETEKLDFRFNTEIVPF